MVAQTASPHLPPAVQPVRAVVWVLHLALPLAGLWLLLAQPPADVRWQHAVSHFWLVLVVAAVNVVLGVRMSVGRPPARRRPAVPGLAGVPGQRRLLPAARAGHAGHAGRTTPTPGFDLAQPVGLALAALFAVRVGAVARRRRRPAVLQALRPVAGAAWPRCVVGWGVGLAARPAAAEPAARAARGRGPADRAPRSRRSRSTSSPRCATTCCTAAQPAAMLHQHHHRVRAAGRGDGRGDPGPQVAAVVVGVARPARAGVRLRRLQRLRPVPARGLQRRPLRRDLGSSRDRPRDPGRVRCRAGGARHRAARASGPARRRSPRRLAERFGLTEGQVAVLDRAGAALAAERDLTVAGSARWSRWASRPASASTTRSCCARRMQTVRPAYGDVRVGLVSRPARSWSTDGGTRRRRSPDGPIEKDGRLAYPLTVKGRLAGVLEAPAAATGDRAPRAARRRSPASCRSRWRTRGSTGSWARCSGSTCRPTSRRPCSPTPTRRRWAVGWSR